MKVQIELKETSQPIILEDVLNTYQKGDLFCVYLLAGPEAFQEERVYKFPISNIWRIKEDYK